MSQRIQITNGPSRDELFDALKLYNEKRLIPFGIIRVGEEKRKPGEEQFLITLIQSIQAEDGSGQSWNLTFHVEKEILDIALSAPKPKVHVHGVAIIGKPTTYSNILNWIKWEREDMQINYDLRTFAPKKNTVLVKAYYSTQTREGVITVE